MLKLRTLSHTDCRYDILHDLAKSCPRRVGEDFMTWVENACFWVKQIQAKPRTQDQPWACVTLLADGFARAHGLELRRAYAILNHYLKEGKS